MKTVETKTSIHQAKVIGKVARVLHLGHDEGTSDEITCRASGGVGSISGTKDC